MMNITDINTSNQVTFSKPGGATELTGFFKFLIIDDVFFQNVTITYEIAKELKFEELKDDIIVKTKDLYL